MIKIDLIQHHDVIGELHIRNTAPDDVGQCITVLTSEFNNSEGDKVQYASRIVIGDCIVAEHEGTILAIIMVSEQSERYDGAEIDYAIVAKKYRHLGLMSRLFDAVIDSIENADIFIHCWYTDGDVHLRYALDLHGFELLEKNIRVYDAKYMGKACCCYCPHYQKSCRCGADLYVRPSHRQKLS